MELKTNTEFRRKDFTELFYPLVAVSPFSFFRHVSKNNTVLDIKFM